MYPYLKQTSKMRAELEELQQTAVAERAEKGEMCRLHNELLKQLKTAEEEKEELQVRRMWKRCSTHHSMCSKSILKSLKVPYSSFTTKKCVGG